MCDGSEDLGRGWAQKISRFRVRRFTEWPKPLQWIGFPVELVTKALIHWMPFFWEVLGTIPLLSVTPLSSPRVHSSGQRSPVLFPPVPFLDQYQEQKISPKRKFLGRTSRGHWGPFARISRPKTSVRAAKSWKKQTFWRGHPWPESTDVHDPKGFPQTSVRKTLGRISFPNTFEYHDTQTLQKW